MLILPTLRNADISRAAVVADERAGQESNMTVLADLEAATTYYLRVQVLRSTHTGSFVVAESGVATYTTP